MSQAVKLVVWGIIIPAAGFSFFGIATMYGYIVLMALLHNFVIREHTPAAYMLTLEAFLIVGYYTVLVCILILGAISVGIGA